MRLARGDRKDLAKLQCGLSELVTDVCEAMVWCLDNADCAVEIAKELLDGLVEDGVALRDRVHRLFLVSDVLSNSGSTTAKSAWCYRREFESHLPAVFEKLQGFYRAEENLLSRERAAKVVFKILQAWEKRAVFAAQYIKGLETSFFKPFESAEMLAPPRGVERPKASAHLPEAIFIKFEEWRSQHFSQLEKIAKARGLNWNTPSAEKGTGGQVPEEEKKSWLLDHLLTYEIYTWETRDQAQKERPEVMVKIDKSRMLLGGGKLHRPAPSEEHSGADDGEDLDGESLSSGDEAFVAHTSESDSRGVAVTDAYGGVRSGVTSAAAAPSSSKGRSAAVKTKSEKTDTTSSSRGRSVTAKTKSEKKTASSSSKGHISKTRTKSEKTVRKAKVEAAD
jgi:hypothetical protein